jgi:hypothetical protein
MKWRSGTPADWADDGCGASNLIYGVWPHSPGVVRAEGDLRGAGAARERWSATRGGVSTVAERPSLLFSAAIMRNCVLALTAVQAGRALIRHWRSLVTTLGERSMNGRSGILVHCCWPLSGMSPSIAELAIALSKPAPRGERCELLRKSPAPATARARRKVGAGRHRSSSAQ